MTQGTDIAVIDDMDFIREIERKDEEQIIALMGGANVTEYVYRFTDTKGRQIQGISFAGTREMAALRGNIRIGKPEVEERDDHWRVMTPATDILRNLTVWGGVHVPKQMKLRDGRFIPDDHAFEKAISKSQRNAIKNLLPVYAVNELLRRLTGEGSGKDAAPKPGAVQADGKFKQPIELLKAVQAHNPDLGWSNIYTALQVQRTSDIPDLYKAYLKICDEQGWEAKT